MRRDAPQSVTLAPRCPREQLSPRSSAAPAAKPKRIYARDTCNGPAPAAGCTYLPSQRRDNAAGAAVLVEGGVFVVIAAAWMCALM
jgi:hypothetical protein